MYIWNMEYSVFWGRNGVFWGVCVVLDIGYYKGCKVVKKGRFLGYNWGVYNSEPIAKSNQSAF